MYGFLLPVMLVSMFAATGTKAFLMAMAFPLGQSAISFLLDAVWGRRKGSGVPATAVGADDNTKSSSSGDGWGASKSSGGYGGWDELLDNNTAAAQEAKRSSNSFSAGNTGYSTKSWPSALGRKLRIITVAGGGGRVEQGVGAPPERKRMRRRGGAKNDGAGQDQIQAGTTLDALVCGSLPVPPIMVQPALNCSVIYWPMVVHS